MKYNITPNKSYYMNPEHSMIFCEWDHPNLGLIPFAAYNKDTVEYGREIYSELVLGVYGTVISYEDSHYWSTIDDNEFDGKTYNIGNLIVSPTGEQPPNSTKIPPPNAFDSPITFLG